MVLRHLTGDAEFDIAPRLPLRFDQIAYLGLRDTEKEEDAVIEAKGILHFNAGEVMKNNEPMDAVIAHLKSTASHPLPSCRLRCDG